METITLYRLVHQVLKVGPWHSVNCNKYAELSDESKGLISKAHNALDAYFFNNNIYADKHPSVHIDFGWGWDINMLCATDSLDILRGWFSVQADIINALADADFTVIAVEVPVDDITVGKSGRQVAYKSDSVISEKDLTILALLA